MLESLQYSMKFDPYYCISSTNVSHVGNYSKYSQQNDIYAGTRHDIIVKSFFFHGEQRKIDYIIDHLGRPAHGQ